MADMEADAGPISLKVGFSRAIFDFIEDGLIVLKGFFEIFFFFRLKYGKV